MSVIGRAVVIVYLWSSMASSLDFRSGRLRTVLEYSVEEEVVPGTIIGSVAVDSGIADRHGPEVVAAMRFRFLTSPPAYLAMDEVRGLLRTVSRIDRESICGDVERRTSDSDEDSCIVRLDVAVQPMNYFRIFKVSRTLIPSPSA